MSDDGLRRSAMPLHSLLNGRYSPRAFSAREVEEHELELVLEAARWAASSMNEQPWRFLVTRRGRKGHAALLATLDPSNRVWADKAPVLLLVLAKRTLSRNGLENFHARHDVGLATAQLTTQATSLGMGLHILGGFNAEVARNTFTIPADFDLVSVIVLGYPGDPEQLHGNLKERELHHSQRRPLNELVFHGEFNG